VPQAARLYEYFAVILFREAAARDRCGLRGGY